MVLRESLVDDDIPRRDKMRETVINHWRMSFEGLRSDLSVSFSVFFFELYKLTLINSNLKDESVSRPMFGQAPIYHPTWP